MKHYPKPWYGAAIVALSSLFYLYEFFLRVSPTVITNELMQHFTIDALQLSFITSAFYIGYTPMQIPAGSLCTRLNLRYVMAAAMAAASLACLFFSLTESYTAAIIWRIIIGVLSAFAFVGPLMLVRRLLEPKYFAVTTGLIQLSGCLGATIGLEPFSNANQILGWQMTLTYTAGIGLILAVAFALFIRDPYIPKPKLQLSNRPKPYALLKDKQIWLIAGNAFCCWAPLAILGELWGVKLLDLKWSLSPTKAEALMNYFWIGVAISSPVAGWISDKIQSRTKPLLLCFLLSVVGSVILIYFPIYNPIFDKILLLVIGSSVAAQTLTFAMVNDYVTNELAGFAYGFNNVAVISSGIILPPITGLILTLVSDGKIINSAPFYSFYDFQQGLVVLPMISLIGVVFSQLVQETYKHE